MNNYSPSPGLLETVITDDSLLKGDVSTHASRGEGVPAMSKSTRAMYRKAMKAAKARDAKSGQICAVLRAKREETDYQFNPVIIEAPVAKVQTLLSDF